MTRALVAMLAVAGSLVPAGAAHHVTPVPAKWSGFTVGETPQQLPPRCQPARVASVLISTVTAFNAGQARRFARAFTRGGQFHLTSLRVPARGYTRSSGAVGRQIIERTAAVLHARGYGFTLTRVDPPTGDANLPYDGIYGVDVDVTRAGGRGFGSSSKVVIDCRSGKISGWMARGRPAA